MFGIRSNISHLKKHRQTKDTEFVGSYNPKSRVDSAWVASEAQMISSAPNLPSSLSCAHHHVGVIRNSMWWLDGSGSSWQWREKNVPLSANPSKRPTTLHCLRAGMSPPLCRSENRAPRSPLKPDLTLWTEKNCLGAFQPYYYRSLFLQ